MDVVIGLDRDTIAAQIGAGLSITAPVVARGELDTGTNVTAVSAAILQRLGAPVQYQTTTQTAAGPLAANVFKVSVGIRNLADPGGDEMVEAALSVMELTTVLPHVEVLIGLDVLLHCKFLLDGPTGHFSLEF